MSRDIIWHKSYGVCWWSCYYDDFLPMISCVLNCPQNACPLFLTTSRSSAADHDDMCRPRNYPGQKARTVHRLRHKPDWPTMITHLWNNNYGNHVLAELPLINALDTHRVHWLISLTRHCHKQHLELFVIKFWRFTLPRLYCSLGKIMISATAGKDIFCRNCDRD